MKTYISILRGINVGGKRPLKMVDLKALYQSLHFKDIKTYVQSGNVIFSTNEIVVKKLETQISEIIKKKYEYDVPVIVFSVDTLKSIIEHNPYIQQKQKDPSFMHITFLAEPPITFKEEDVLSQKRENEAIVISNNAVYLYCPNGYGKTKLHNAFLEKKLNVKATTRNWKTTLKLLDLASE